MGFEDLPFLLNVVVVIGGTPLMLLGGGREGGGGIMMGLGTLSLLYKVVMLGFWDPPLLLVLVIAFGALLSIDL